MVQELTMVFRQRRLSPINSIKHVIDGEGTATEIPSTVPLATAVPVASSVFSPVEVVVGAKINAFFITVFMIGSTGAPINTSANWLLWKGHEGQTGGSVKPTPGNTGISKVRNQIIHEEKGVPGSGDGTPMVFKGVIVVPRGMRRVREGDFWEIRLGAINAANDMQFCVKAIYKSFR